MLGWGGCRSWGAVNIHVISWVQIRYRMPVDVALVPFAALALVTLAAYLRSGWRSLFKRSDG